MYVKRNTGNSNTAGKIPTNITGLIYFNICIKICYCDFKIKKERPLSAAVFGISHREAFDLAGDK